jgi:hypothetical protein
MNRTIYAKAGAVAYVIWGHISLIPTSSGW